MTSHTTRRSRGGRLAVLGTLAAGLLLSACSDDGDDRESSDAGTGSGTETAASSPAPAAGETPDAPGVANALDSLGQVLAISLPEASSHELDEDTSTLVIRFDSGSKDDTYSHCLISRSAAQGLGLPADYKLVMSYPDGEKDCAQP